MRGIFLRSPGGIQSIFAYESFVNELAAMAGIDPLDMRLRNTHDERDRAALEKVAQMSDWRAMRKAKADKAGPTVKGRGLAMARYGAGESRSALVIDVTVEKATGHVAVDRAFMAFDCGYVVNPDGAMNQVEGGLLQGLSRSLHEQVRFDKKMVTTRNWADYPILTFTEVPEVHVELISRPDLPWASTGEAGTVTTAAAVANAVFDAIGKYPRRIPLAPDYIKTLI
jgi:CO/xanthine dehydrogenase Mo-binding subunit